MKIRATTVVVDVEIANPYGNDRVPLRLMVAEDGTKVIGWGNRLWKIEPVGLHFIPVERVSYARAA